MYETKTAWKQVLHPLLPQLPGCQWEGTGWNSRTADTNQAGTLQWGSYSRCCGAGWGGGTGQTGWGPLGTSSPAASRAALLNTGKDTKITHHTSNCLWLLLRVNAERVSSFHSYFGFTDMQTGLLLTSVTAFPPVHMSLLRKIRTQRGCLTSP